MTKAPGTPLQVAQRLQAAALDMIQSTGKRVDVTLRCQGEGSWTVELQGIGDLTGDDLAYMFAVADALDVPWAYVDAPAQARAVEFGAHRTAFARPGDRVPHRSA